jgi:hypothetical protein
VGAAAREDLHADARVLLEEQHAPPARGGGAGGGPGRARGEGRGEGALPPATSDV